MVVAQFDLSCSLGLSGRFDHPDFAAACARIEKAANAAGLPLSGFGATPEQVAGGLARGYRIFANFDVLMLKGAVAAQRAWREA